VGTGNNDADGHEVLHRNRGNQLPLASSTWQLRGNKCATRGLAEPFAHAYGDRQDAVATNPMGRLEHEVIAARDQVPEMPGVVVGIDDPVQIGTAMPASSASFLVRGLSSTPAGPYRSSRRSMKTNWSPPAVSSQVKGRVG